MTTQTTITKDPAAGTMTVETRWPASPERLWRLWADPRQLERWWGPPTHPATVTDHDLTAGGIVRYFMTGPDGERYHGLWHVLTVEEPVSLTVRDAFANDDGTENTDLPGSTMTVRIDAIDAATSAMTIHSVFPTPEAMQRVLEMGMEEGLQQALGQIDALLAE